MSKRLVAISIIIVGIISVFLLNLNLALSSKAAAPSSEGNSNFQSYGLAVGSEKIYQTSIEDYSFFEQFLVAKEAAVAEVVTLNKENIVKEEKRIEQERIAAEKKRLEEERKRAEAERKKKEEEERLRKEEEERQRLAYEAELARQAEAQRQAELQRQQEQKQQEISALTATLGVDNIKTRICEVFGPQCENALIIAKYESTFNPGAYYNGNYGIFQINCPSHSWRVGGDCNALFDFETNLRIAKQIYDEQGWGPWSTKIHL